MSKTKNMVIDDQNQRNEAAASEQQVKNRSRDINRLTNETNCQLFNVLTQAMSQVQGDRKFVETVADSELYCEILNLQGACFARVLKHDRKAQKYEDMEMDELLKELYQRMQTLYHYGACHGRELPGIAWTEEGGRFIIHLRDCAINMEHSICDEHRLPGWKGTINELSGSLYAVGYDPDVDCESGELTGRYEEAFSFFCELNTDDPDNTEHGDIVLCHRSWQHLEAIATSLPAWI